MSHVRLYAPAFVVLAWCLVVVATGEAFAPVFAAGLAVVLPLYVRELARHYGHRG